MRLRRLTLLLRAHGYVLYTTKWRSPRGHNEALMNWIRRIRGAIGMGVTWAVLWGFAGVLLAAVNSVMPGLGWFFRIFDAPAPALALPGLVGGTLFSIVLGIVARGRKFSE